MINKLNQHFRAKTNKFINDIIKYKQENNISTLVVYGAGVYGQRLYRLLQESEINVKCFCVSDKSYNKRLIDNIPVVEISSLQDVREEILVLIAAKFPTNQSMVKTIREMGFNHYLLLPENFDKMTDDVFFRPALEITPKVGCSVNCKYCPQELFVKTYCKNSNIPEMSFEKFKECIDKTPGDLLIDFSGFVEPFLAEDTVKMMHYAQKIGRDMRLFTTLVGLDANKFEAIKNIPFKYVVLHLPDEAEYAHIPLTEDYWDLLALVMNTYRVDGKPFVDSANCQSKPHPRAVEIVGGKVGISWNLYDRAGNLEGDVLQSTSTRHGALYCDRALNMNHNVLLPNGDIVLCCMDFGMRYVLGNLLKQDYDEIMNGEVFVNLKKELIDDCVDTFICRKCIFAKKRTGEFGNE